MRRTIRLSLDSRSIEAAIAELEAYKVRIDEKASELTRRLADIGVEQATVQFTAAAYDGINDVNVRAEPTERGYAVIAQGEAVCFIEFGAGVAYNGTDASYPGIRPPEISSIGEFGLGHGADEDENGDPLGWWYPTAAGYKHTYGNPPAAAMYFASNTMRSQITQICREVFST